MRVKRCVPLRRQPGCKRLRTGHQAEDADGSPCDSDAHVELASKVFYEVRPSKRKSAQIEARSAGSFENPQETVDLVMTKTEITIFSQRRYQDRIHIDEEASTLPTPESRPAIARRRHDPDGRNTGKYLTERTESQSRAQS